MRPRPRPAARWSVRLRATVAATAIVAVALGGAAAALTTVLRDSLEQSTAEEAHRRAAQAAGMLAVPVVPVAAGSPGPNQDTPLDQGRNRGTQERATTGTPGGPGPHATTGPGQSRRTRDHVTAGTTRSPGPHQTTPPDPGQSRRTRDHVTAGTTRSPGPHRTTAPDPGTRERVTAGSPGPSRVPEKGSSVGEVPDPDVRIGTPAKSVGADWAGDGYLTASTTVATGQGTLTVVARTSLEPARKALADLGRLLFFGIPALLLLVAAMTWLSVGRALAPVSAIRAELADITARDLHRRVPVPSGRDEIAALARTVNATLDRLENAVRQHKRFVADAAHELRSPIATVRTRLELAAAHPPAREALADVGRLQTLAADLLLLAALDAGEPPRSDEVDLGQVAAEEALRPRPKADVKVRVAADPDVVVHGSRHHLARLVTNLVDNAVRHAASAVEVRVRAEEAAALLEVRDDGPGIPPEDREAVFDRFTRLDDARTRDAGGSGLGLAIVKEIATRHGGTVTITDAPAGGACFTVRIPDRRQDGRASGRSSPDRRERFQTGSR